MTSILTGDCLEMLPTLATKSVQCCVTSPPYYGLRDYGHPAQIGLEPTIDAYVAKMVHVFREVRRVLADDGTLWLNLGDSYGGAKNLLGIPWRVAFALQADGWTLRQDIIWHKPNPMPESVRDRCTKAHEYLFMLTKGNRYWFDQEAIKESAKYPRDHGFLRGPVDGCNSTTIAWRAASQAKRKIAGIDSRTAGKETRNRRSVWTVASEPCREAHFAVMPTRLVEPCILAGSRPGDLVLDPFGGAGTVGLVATRLQRRALLIEVNPEYVEIARRRMALDDDAWLEAATR